MCGFRPCQKSGCGQPRQEDLRREIERLAVSPAAEARNGVNEDEGYKIQKYGNRAGPTQRTDTAAEKANSYQGEQTEGGGTVKNESN